MAKHVIISGGSKGIGKSLAIKYAAQGAHVTIIARNQHDLEVAGQEIEQNRLDQAQQVRAISLDLTVLSFPTASKGEIMTEEQNAILGRILGSTDRCDILINCCGAATPSQFEDLTQDQFKFMMDVNYFSAVNLTRFLLPTIKARSSNAQIVFVSSMCGLLSFYGYSAYSASKFALVGLAEALRMELEPEGIIVTVSFPPDTKTPGFEEENKLKPMLTAEISNSGSVYSPDKVAESIVRDVRDKRFYSTVGFENWLAIMACNSFMPKTFGSLLLEILIAAPLKAVAFAIVNSWYKMARAASPRSKQR